MNIEEYQEKVIELFQSGDATETQWREMARAVLDASENTGTCESIDRAIDPDQWQEDEDGEYPGGYLSYADYRAASGCH